MVYNNCESHEMGATKKHSSFDGLHHLNTQPKLLFFFFCLFEEKLINLLLL